MDFATRLRELRQGRCLSQSELADKLNVSKSSISMYENGNRVPDLEMLELLADYFNVDINYITGKDNGSTYYLDPAVAELAQQLNDNAGMRVLLDASRNISAEDMEFVIQLIEKMAKNK